MKNIDKIPRFDDLFNPTLEAIRRLGGSASIKEIENEVIESMNIPSDIANIPQGERAMTALQYNLAWARSYLKKYGLINNSERAVWSFTPLGHKTTTVNSEEVKKSAIQKYNQERAINLSDTVHTKDEVVVHISSKISSEEKDIPDDSDLWRMELLEILKEMTPDAFESLCLKVLRESGFEATGTGGSGDMGIDGRGLIRLNGLISFRVIFQFKRYKDSVTPKIVREFRGAMQGNAEKGIIITTGSFTKDAKKEATKDGAPLIDLIDGELLIDRLHELKLGINTETIVKIDPSFFQNI